uniref:Uncharacterized protein n=1 Tax=Lepeophtheirus salmonis TaxID=72036 RepID=A0A0K2URT9_LEPSM
MTQTFQLRSSGWRMRTFTCSSLDLSVYYSVVLWNSIVLIC